MESYRWYMKSVQVLIKGKLQYSILPECEVGTETWALQDLHGIIKGNGFRIGIEGDREQTTITTFRVAQAIIKGSSGAEFRIVNFFDYRYGEHEGLAEMGIEVSSLTERGGFQHSCDFLRCGVDLGNP